MSEPLSDADLRALVRRALDEDVGEGDVTTAATVPPGARARAVVVQKAPGVIYGLAVAEATFDELDPAARFETHAAEGEWREGGDVFTVEGDARALLAAERTALNFLARLSGIATLAARCVAAVEGTGATVLDTRKTTPGLRALEKAAVRAGGARNHRAGLYDAILIKENHSAMAGGVGEAVRKARAARTRPAARGRGSLARGGRGGPGGGRPADPAGQHDARPAARDGGARRRPRRARMQRWDDGDSIRDHAATGVQFVSVGALTHSAPALDLSLRLEPL